jgi:hypothetical protein
MTILAIVVAIFGLGIGIIIGWMINDNIMSKKYEKAEVEKYERYNNIRKKIRRKFFDEITKNIDIISMEMKESALTRSIKSRQFLQKVYRKNIFKLKDKPVRDLVRDFYIYINMFSSESQALSNFFDRMIRDNPELSSEKKNDIQMILINIKLGKLDEIKKFGLEVKEELKKLEMAERTEENKVEEET